MPVRTTWNNVTTDDRWRNAPPEDRVKIRQNYFDKVVTPAKSHASNFSALRKEFFDRTEGDIGGALEAPEKQVSPIDAINQKMSKSLGRLGTAIKRDVLIETPRHVGGFLQTFAKQRTTPQVPLSEQPLSSFLLKVSQEIIDDANLREEQRIDLRPYQKTQEVDVLDPSVAQGELDPKLVTGFRDVPREKLGLTRKADVPKPFEFTDLFDPEFAGQTIGETIGTVVTSTATGIAGTLLGGPVAGAVSAAAPIFIIETGSAYNEMIDRGIDPEQASRAAINIGTINAVIEQASLFPLFKSLGISKIARRKMVKGITDEMVKRARLGNIPKTGGVQFITEGLEEVTQTLNQIGQTNQLIKDTDKKIKGDEVVEQVIKSFYGGALIGGGLGGGAGVIGTVKARGEIGKAKRAEVQADDAGKAATLKAIGEAILLERITKAKEIFEANGFTDETRDALIKDVTGKDNLESLNDAEMRDVGRALKESINEGLIYNADRVADTEPEVKEPVVPAAAPAKPKVAPAKPKVAKPKVAKPDIPAPKTPTEGVKPEVIEPVVPEKPVPEEKVKEIKEAVKDVETNPTEKQIESGNYKKGHVKISGLDVAIENPSGSFRSGVDADGETWNTKMHGHYGYIKRTEGADGEQVDVFINPKTPESDNVFVVFQNDPKTGKFDEHKVMMGYQSPSQAKRGYLSNYEQGWKGFGSIEEMTHDEFKAWLKSDKPKKTPKRVKPVAEPTAPAAKPKVAKPKVAKPKVAKPKVEELAVQKPVQKPVQEVPVTPAAKPKVEELAVQKPVQKPVQKVPVTPTPADAKAKKGESHKKGKITIKEIRRSIIEDFGVPLRVGKFRKKVKGGERLGMFKIKPEVIRTAEYHDLPTISHELAHFIDKKWNLKGLRERSPELAGLDYDPSKRRTSEGFAEYIRYWVTGSADPTVIAPKFTVKFNEFLDKDNELRTKLNRVKNNITTWREQGAAERLYSQIDFDGKQSIKNFGRFLKRTTYEIRRLLEDDLIFLDRFERQVMGVKSISGAVRDLIINPAVSPTAMARHSAKTAEARAESMVLDGVFDFSGQDVYKSLVEILRPVRDDIKNFITYGISKRSIELHGRAIQPGFDLGDALYFVDKFETEIFKKVHKEFKEFQDRVFQITIDAGVISVKQAEVILSLNVEYIPLKRSFERGEIESAFTGVGNKIAHPGSPIKKIKGSGRAVVNPLQSVIQNTAQIISASDKTRIIRAIVKLVESKEGFGNWVENIPIPKVPVKITLESMKKSLSDVGIDVDNNVDMEQILTFYTNGRQYSGKDNVISFWHDGKMKLYELDPDLYKTLKAIDKVQLPPIIDFIFGKPARAVRAGATGYRAGFALITNPMHDIFGMALQTEYARAATTPYISMRAIIKRIKGRKNDKIVKLFKRSGVEFGNFVGIDRKNLQSAVDSVLGSPARMKEFNIVEHPIQALSIILRSIHFYGRKFIEGYKQTISVTESGPRLAEFEAAYKTLEKEWGEKSIGAFIGASNAAADVTINFRRAGVWGQTLNQMIPFFNSVVQSPFKFGRYVRAHPVKAALKGMVGLTLPTLTLWWLHKDDEWYKEMPAWLKYGFFHFPLGGTGDKPAVIIRIPRPFVWSTVFSATPEMIWNFLYDKDAGELKKTMKHLTFETAPPMLPQSIKVPVELWANYDFFRDRNIDPYWDIEQKNPEDRYSPYTSETAKFIGKQFSLSPRKIEHAIGSSTGGLGMDLIRAGEGSVGKIKQPADIPVAGRLFVRKKTEEQRRKKIKYERDKKVAQIKKLVNKDRRGQAKSVMDSWNRRFPNNAINFDL